MQGQGQIVEEEVEGNEIQADYNKQESQKGKRDFNAVKMQRIMKLQQILSKNVKLREAATSGQLRQFTPLIERKKPSTKASLPLIPSHYLNQTEILASKNLYEKKSATQALAYQAPFENSLLKKYRQTLFLKNGPSRTFVKYELEDQILEQNPDSTSDQGFEDNPQSDEIPGQRSILKLKVKNLQYKQKNKGPLEQHQNSKRLKKSKSKHSILVSNSSLYRMNSIQRLTAPNSKHTEVQKLEKKDFRRKKRNASTLNLTKIQHLPQIVFPVSKKCTKTKFPSMSMAQIDNNLISNQISELQQKISIEARTRDKKERILKEKIKSHQRAYVLQSIFQ